MKIKTRGAHKSDNEWIRGWPVIIASGIGYGTGGSMILLLAGLFIKPMRDQLGWSTTAVTISPMITLVWALFYPFTGAVIDRVGSRKVAIIGVMGLALSVLILAIVPVSQLVLFAVAALIGIFASMSAVPTYSRGIASWFRRDLGLALGVALSGSAVVAVFATPLTGYVIADHGWQAGFMTISAIIMFLGAPLIVLFYRERPGEVATDQASSEPVTGSSLVEAARDIRFWCYLLSFTCACVALGGTLAHLQPMLADKGLPLAEALSLGVLYALAMTIGKIAGGFLLDRFWPFAIAAVITGLAAVGAAGLASVDMDSPYLLIALLTSWIGLAQGAEADFIAFFVLRSFGMRKFSTIVGVLAMVVTLGLTLGALVYGALYDVAGSYNAASYLGASCLVAASILILAAGACEIRVKRKQAASS